MLAYASAKYQQTDLGWLCADAENLSLQSDSQALIFSNFALQWCSCLDTLAAELHRVLQPSGQLLLAVPGPETLTELRQAWAQVDDQVHINRFASLQQWQQALANAGFSSIQLTSEPVVEQHRSVRELLLELKQVGAHNSNAGKSATITGKQRLKALYNAYEHFRLPSGELPATWEIISGLVSK
jgi:malonyl-CoA O-methyltransferase